MTTITRNVYVDGQKVAVNARDPAIAASSRCVHTGYTGASSTTMGTDTTPVVTETYIVEFYVPELMLVTGVALLNGSAAAGNITAWATRADGTIFPETVTASTAQSGTAGFQRIPFGTAITLRPGTHYLAFQFDSVSARFRTHAVGNFGASKATGTVYGTTFNVTAPTTFTAGQGPVASLY